MNQVKNHTPDYRPCSGQSWTGTKRTWGIYDANGEPWWRAQDSAGKIRLFSSYEKALEAAKALQEAFR